jgi:nitronate monooxygenase
LSRILIARLGLGDLEGHVRRALRHFPMQEPVEEILAKYYIPGGKAPDVPYKTLIPYSLEPPIFLDQITVIANFVEVFLAKEGHNHPIGINLLEKVQLPNMASLYGAMLAGIDVVLMGAGIPIQIPGILDKLAHHEATSYRVDVVGASAEDDYRLHFDPERVFPGITAKVGELHRPLFFPIISSFVLGQALLKRSEGRIDGFIVELPIAGGHNAPPRGQVKLNEEGEPIYGEKDEVDFQKISSLGLPFWIGGGYGSVAGLQRALEVGAAGIQVGTAFAYCDESGMNEKFKRAILEKVIKGEAKVLTSPTASPTGFPFKVVQVEDSLTDPEIYAARKRRCDMGFLRTLYKQEDGTVGYRCPAEPVEDYVRKGGVIEDTVNRTCLCNNLGANAGFPQIRRNGYVEPPLVTSGNDLVNIARFLKPGEKRYTAADVIAYLLSSVEQAIPAAHSEVI